MIQRNTHQRDSIRDVIEAADRPLSPIEILDGAQRRVPRLGMATVYRTVKELVESRWLRPVELPGEPARYELAEKAHHHHFHCRQCNRVYDIPGCPGDLRPLLPAGFELQDHEVVLYGKCEKCTTGAIKGPKGKRIPAAKIHVHGPDCDHANAALAPAVTVVAGHEAQIPGADGRGRGKGFGREQGFVAIADDDVDAAAKK